MCRNLKRLFNYAPPVTEEEMYTASVQFVRKISGFSKPSKSNEAAFQEAATAIAAVTCHLLYSLKTKAPPKSRTEEVAQAHARAAHQHTPSSPSV
jgi:hypothetical protein